MSASLVGSEMCIRDSPRRSQPKNAGGNQTNKNNKTLNNHGLGLSVALYTVSYTHLTLPTICSV
eukprot:2374516-Alexandrium_andersonii.AAC.1